MSGDYSILPSALQDFSQKGHDELALWHLTSTCVVCFMGAWVTHLYSYNVNQISL